MARPTDVSYYCSRLEGKAVCWPVRVVREGDGFTSVVGLAGRFKGRSFSAISNEVTSYVPLGYAMARGTSEYAPRALSAQEYGAAKDLLDKLRRAKSTPAALAGLLDRARQLAATLRARSAGDAAWRHFDADVARAEDALAARRLDEARVHVRDALQMIEGAASRTARDPAVRWDSQRPATRRGSRRPRSSRDVGPITRRERRAPESTRISPAAERQVQDMTWMLHRAGYRNEPRQVAIALRERGVSPAELAFRIEAGDFARDRSREDLEKDAWWATDPNMRRRPLDVSVRGAWVPLAEMSMEELRRYHQRHVGRLRRELRVSTKRLRGRDSPKRFVSTEERIIRDITEVLRREGYTRPREDALVLRHEGLSLADVERLAPGDSFERWYELEKRRAPTRAGRDYTVRAPRSRKRKTSSPRRAGRERKR